jgi:hypothetical protein
VCYCRVNVLKTLDTKAGTTISGTRDNAAAWRLAARIGGTKVTFRIDVEGDSYE